MTLLSQYEIYKGYIFTECSLTYDGCFLVENRKSQNNYFSWVFTERVTNVLSGRVKQHPFYLVKNSYVHSDSFRAYLFTC